MSSFSIVIEEFFNDIDYIVNMLQSNMIRERVCQDRLGYIRTEHHD